MRCQSQARVELLQRTCLIAVSLTTLRRFHAAGGLWAFYRSHRASGIFQENFTTRGVITVDQIRGTCPSIPPPLRPFTTVFLLVHVVCLFFAGQTYGSNGVGDQQDRPRQGERCCVQRFQHPFRETAVSRGWKSPQHDTLFSWRGVFGQREGGSGAAAEFTGGAISGGLFHVLRSSIVNDKCTQQYSRKYCWCG